LELPIRQGDRLLKRTVRPVRRIGRWTMTRVLEKLVRMMARVHEGLSQQGISRSAPFLAL